MIVDANPRKASRHPGLRFAVSPVLKTTFAEDPMIRQAIFWAAALYLGRKAYASLSKPRSGVPAPRLQAAPPLNPVIQPELAERLRSVVTTR